MNIEKEIFAKTQVDFKKLKEYGFKKEDNHFIFSKNFMDNQFKAVILVGNDGKVSGKVYDLEMDEEYTFHGLRMTACVARSRVLVPFPETFRDTET